MLMFVMKGFNVSNISASLVSCDMPCPVGGGLCGGPNSFKVYDATPTMPKEINFQMTVVNIL